MKRICFVAVAFSLWVCSCGSGNTNDGYPADTSSLNPTAGALDSNIAPMAGTRGTPENTIGGDSIINEHGEEIEAQAPDSNATNPNIRE